jgi:hypothetical protein
MLLQKSGYFAHCLAVPMSLIMWLDWQVCHQGVGVASVIADRVSGSLQQVEDKEVCPFSMQLMSLKVSREATTWCNAGVVPDHAQGNWTGISINYVQKEWETWDEWAIYTLELWVTRSVKGLCVWSKILPLVFIFRRL